MRPLAGVTFSGSHGETKISKFCDRAESWHLYVFEDADHECDAGFAIGGHIRRKKPVLPPGQKCDPT